MLPNREKQCSLRKLYVNFQLTQSQISRLTVPGTLSTVLCWRQRDWPYSSGGKIDKYVCMRACTCVCYVWRREGGRGREVGGREGRGREGGRGEEGG